MVISNFNFISIVVCPFKTNPPLIIDSDTVLTFAAAIQHFQMI